MLRTAVLAALLAAPLVACVTSPSKGDVDDDFTDLANADPKADGFSTKLKIMGELAQGQLGAGTYTTRPRYRGYTFRAPVGSEVDVFVSMDRGDPIAWILDSGFNIVAKNDDFDPTTTVARLHTMLPLGGLHYVVFREITEEFSKTEYLVDPEKLGGPAAGCTLTAMPDRTTIAGTLTIDLMSSGLSTCTAVTDLGGVLAVPCNGQVMLAALSFGPGDHTLTVTGTPSAVGGAAKSCSVGVHIDL